jgi:hypothetical protein
MSCRCDVPRLFPPLRIAPGLGALPRAIGAFADFREAMLEALPSVRELAGWRARGDGDLGLMLLEMGAYVCDVLAFYDEVFAGEAYLRTAARRPSLRKLVALLGYVPHPAVSAAVRLAVLAGGRQPIVLPQGTSFRSGAFAGGKPQVFELDADSKVHPLVNRFRLVPPAQRTASADRASFLALKAGTKAQVGDLVLLRGGGGEPVARRVAALAPHVGADGTQYLRVAVADPGAAASGPPSAQALASLFSLLGIGLGRSAQIGPGPFVLQRIAAANRGAFFSGPSSGGLDPGGPIALGAEPLVLQRPGQQALLWTGAGAGASSGDLLLNTLYRSLAAGSDVIVTAGGGAAAFQVASVRETSLTVPAGSATDAAGKVTKFTAQVPVTRVVLGGSWPFGAADPATVTLHFGFSEVAREAQEPGTAIGMADPLLVQAPVEAPADGTSPRRVLLQDLDGTGVEGSAQVDYTTPQLTQFSAGPGISWGPLRAPVLAYGNVVSATQGETVPHEALGAGDASAANQSFALQKGPLTYVMPAGAAAPVSSLQVRVDGVLWHEVPTFFGQRPDAHAYIVRAGDDGVATVTFGDGVRGARLPSGAGVAASYRFGAGAQSPPAGSISQLGSPVPGLLAIKNPLAAAGGADAEPASGLRRYAPRSALVLGRAVSIADMEALAAAAPGVRAVRAEWAWSGSMQRAAVVLRYVGPASQRDTVRGAVRNEADPAAPIDAIPATPVPATLGLEVKVDGSYQEANVLPQVRAALATPGGGPLSPELIGIGVPLYFSRILAATLAVEGVAAVKGLTWNGSPPADFAVSPGVGKWFDLESAGDLVLNGRGRHG